MARRVQTTQLSIIRYWGRVHVGLFTPIAEINQYARICKLNPSLSYTHEVRSGFTLVSLLSLFLLRLYEIFRCSFDFLDPQCPTNKINTLRLWHSVMSLLVKCVKIYTSRSESQFWVCRHDRCVRRGRGARHWTGQAAFSPKLHLKTVAWGKKWWDEWHVNRCPEKEKEVLFMEITKHVNAKKIFTFRSKKTASHLLFCTSSAACWCWF